MAGPPRKVDHRLADLTELVEDAWREVALPDLIAQRDSGARGVDQ